MKNIVFSLMVILSWTACSVICVADEPLTNLTLEQCYQLALVRSERIAISQQVIKEAEGRFSQAFSGILPQVSFEDSEKFQDRSKNSYIPQRQFVFSQPLFSGFKEFAAIAASKAEHRQREQELVRAKQLLFIDVSDAFYLLQRYDEELKTVEDIHAALQNHVDELNKRESLGRSRSSEVASTETRLYQAEADIELVRSQKAIASQLMDFLVGKHVESLAPGDLISGQTTSEPDYENMANRRPDVVAAAEAFKVAQKEVTIARAGYFPTVSLLGNSYVKRSDSSADVDWDAAVNVNVPLFTGGETKGLVKEANARMEEAKLILSQTQRQAVLDIQNEYTTLLADQKQAVAYEKTVVAAQKNYELQNGDYKNNSVSNLDVLQALQDLQIVQRSYIAIKTDTQRSFARLKVATGDIAP